MGDLTRSEISKARRYRQPLLRLSGKALSQEAKELVSHCLNEIVLPKFSVLSKPRPTSVERMQGAVEALLAGLLIEGPEWGAGWARRPLSNDSFSGEPVGRVVFSKVLSAMTEAGLVDVATGAGTRETRLRLSETGRGLAESYGVTLGNTGLHFETVD